jgi:peptide/nickel transport system substrate-binding protein
VREFGLTANPAYAKRHAGQPTIRDIRFVDVAGVNDLADEVKNDRIHILTDVPTADLPKYEALPNAVVATAANPRRIHLLAVNHRVDALQAAEVRRGIQAAIDREGILNEVFRAGQAKMHKAMTGPFPPGSWAAPKGEPLFKPSAKVPAGAPLTLIYPDDEPLAKAACERIARQVTAAGRPLKAEGVPPRDFLLRLELEHRYDLAYVTFDYPHDWYPAILNQFFNAGAADRGGANVTGYLAPGTNAIEADRTLAGLLATFGSSRDFEGVWKPRAWEIHAKFAEVVPFVPLWQLDRHTILSKNVKLPFPANLLPPTTLFADVRNWKLIESK